MRNIVIRSSNLSSAYEKSKRIADNIDTAKSLLNAFKSDADSYSSGWVEKYYTKHINKSYCSVDRNNSKYWNVDYNDDGSVDKKFLSSVYQSDAEEAAKEWVRLQRREYINAMSDLLSEVPSAAEKMKTVRSSLQRLEKVKEEFNTTPFNIEEIFSTINGDSIVGNDFVWETEKYVDDATGEEVEYKVLYKYDEKSNIKMNLNAAVNCAVTTIGAASDNVVAVASLLASDGIPKEKVDEKLKSMLSETGAAIQDYQEKGFFNVTTQAGIASMYEDATGLEYDEETVRTDYNSIFNAYYSSSEEQGDYLLGLMGGAPAFGGIGMALAISNRINEKGELSDEEKEQYNLNKYIRGREHEGRVDENIHHFAADSERNEEFREILFDSPAFKEFNSEERQGILSNASLENNTSLTNDKKYTEIITEEKYSQFGEGDINTLEDLESKKGYLELETITDNDLPKKIEDKTVSSEDIDTLASEEYFKKYSTEDIYSNRTKLLEEYNGMSEGEKVEALQGLGYRDEVISDIVTNGTAGVTAYVIGHQNMEMANISNQIAMQQGITGHDTAFDNPVSSSYFTDGKANVDLATPSVQVQQARTSLNQAKISYDSAITRANSAIDEANEAKNEYTRKVQVIKKNSGDDPKNWSEEEIDEYNKVTAKYNNAVAKANTEANNVETEKANYEMRKQNYELAKKDFANEVEIGIKDDTGEVTVTTTQPEYSAQPDNQSAVSTDISLETPTNQTLISVDENGNFVSETRVSFDKPVFEEVKATNDNVTVNNTLNYTNESIDNTVNSSSTNAINDSLNVNELQQLQQYATIITEQEARESA